MDAGDKSIKDCDCIKSPSLERFSSFSLFAVRFNLTEGSLAIGSKELATHLRVSYQGTS
jgi:hypothetical protein